MCIIAKSKTAHNKFFALYLNSIVQEGNMDFFTLVVELGFPIAGSIAAGYFIFLTLKFILAGVNSAVYTVCDIIKRLDNRVTTMNTDIQRLDAKISHALGLAPDYDRIARAEQKDQRID
jgi:uncharacterized membrane protein YozB (DUF420 family)